MSILLRIVLILISLMTLSGMMKKIRKSKLQIEYAIFWIIILFLIIILALIPELAVFVADILGIQSPVNLIFLFMIFVLMLKCFNLTIEVSNLEYKVQELTQKLALDEYEENKEEKKEEK